jgi:hypothetical protein
VQKPLLVPLFKGGKRIHLAVQASWRYKQGDAQGCIICASVRQHSTHPFASLFTHANWASQLALL